jgi:hypothetical protein
MAEPGTGRTLAGESPEEHVAGPRREKKSLFGRSLWGMVVGAVLGAVLTDRIYTPADMRGVDDWLPYLALLLGGAAVGAAIGAAVGAMVARTRARSV